VSFSYLGVSPWIFSHSLWSSGENLVRLTRAGGVEVGAPQSPWDIVFKTFGRFLLSSPLCSHLALVCEGWLRLSGAVQLLVRIVGGCPSSMFSMVPIPLPLVLGGHSGRFVGRARAKLVVVLSKGRHVVLVTSLTMLQALTDVGDGGLHGGGCLTRRRLTFEASMERGMVWCA
jgi:hypothetical protein